MTNIENKKSIMMDKVYNELKDILSTIVVKLDFVANREETVEMKSAADEYIAAIKLQDNFNTYTNYSEYAVYKADLGIECAFDKSLIPYDKRKEVASYQRDFVLTSFVEKNNYYRMLSGLPDIDDEEFIYLSEVINIDIEGVDETKPLHEMTVEEINIINVSGYLDKLIELHPDKKYLKHLDEETKIPIYESRNANNFNILYIYRDKTKQPVSEMFISIYNKTREYVLDRFYDKAYGFKSSYYDGYIGLFILTITVQRFITNYFTKFINRDFYDKDIIKLLFSSYGLPFYNDIPLSYLQKIAKNLNRLLIYKSTDRVFTDIFKIFDMDNIEVCNYVLFKNPKLDNKGKPVIIYKEKTELGYQIETSSDLLSVTDNFTGVIKLDYDNVKQIEEIEFNNEYCKIILLNNGLVTFETPKNSKFYDSMMTRNVILNDYNVLQFNEYFDVESIKEVKLKDNTSEIYFICKKSNILYKFSHCKFEKIDLKEILSIDKSINNIIIKHDEISLKQIICINYLETSEIYDLQSYDKLGSLDETVINGDYYDNAIMLTMESGKLFIYGDNKNNRMLNIEEKVFDQFVEVNDVLPKVIDVKLFDLGCVFIMADGTVRYTRQIPFMEEIIPVHTTDILKYSGIKNIFDILLNNKKVYCLTSYSGNLYILNYNYSENYGQLLFKSDIPKPTCSYRYIKNICETHNGIIITTYGNNSIIGYSGKNEDNNFPFISTLNMVNQENDLNIQFIQIYKGYMFFTTIDNKLYVFRGHELQDLTKFVKDENFQNLINIGEELFILVGKPYMYVINGTSNEDMFINKIIMDKNKIIMNVIKDGNNYNDLIVKCNDGKYYKYKDNKFIDIKYYNCFHAMNNISVLVKPVESNNEVSYFMDLSIDNKLYNNIKISNIKNLVSITICEDILFLDCDTISFIKLKDINETTKEIISINHTQLTNKRAKSIRINDNLLIYNKTGGISILRNFIHADRLDTQINEDYVSLFDDVMIDGITFDEDNIIKLENTTKYVTYEPVVKDMYDLSFVEVPMGAPDVGKYLNDTQYHLNYDLVISDDKLWGGDRDRDEFLKNVLDNEYNYTTSKYISINSTYDLMKLNFEVCYMFKMLTELKESEKYLNVDIKFVGETPLFEAVIGLFALTCKKFGLEGNILNTKTQTMSVLGFNFSVDSQYIAKIVKDAKIYDRDPNFKIEDIEIIKNPTLFKNSSEILNLYLDNQSILQNIYDYMYNAKSIEEYNAYKKIEQAELFSKYNEEIYKIDDKYAHSYLDYIKRVNPKLYKVINDANDENMVEVIDYILLALTNFLDSEKFEFLFLNIPSLSLDLIKKFIYYLVDVFKSYTVDLKAMNVIYHIDDKRLSNLKMILNDNFRGKFTSFDKNMFIDYMDYILSEFEIYDKLKMLYKTHTNNSWSYQDKSLLFKIFQILPSVVDEKYTSLIEDFADFFDMMNGIWDWNNGEGDVYEFIHKEFISNIINRFDQNLMSKLINLTVNKENSEKIIERELNSFINHFCTGKTFIIYIYDKFVKSGFFVGKDISNYIDIINNINHMKLSSEETFSDFGDSIINQKTLNEINDIKYSEYYYFIRSGE